MYGKKNKLKNSLKTRSMISGLLVILMMSSPIMSYAAETNTNISDLHINANQIDNANDTINTDSMHVNSESTKFLFLNFKSANGKIIIDRTSDDTNIQTIRIDNIKNVNTINVYDAKGAQTDSLNAEENNYTYALETGYDEVINIKAIADDGFNVSEYLITGIETGEETTDFITPTAEFVQPVIMDDDKTVSVDFTKIDTQMSREQEGNNTDLTVNDGDDGESVKNNNLNDLTVNSKKADTTMQDNQDSSGNDDLTVESQNNKAESQDADGDEECAGVESHISSEEADIDANTDINALTLDDNINAVSSDNPNPCYIKAYEISKLMDGTAPFDTDNNAGNDSANDNQIVRSFDNINYTLKYTTAIKDTETAGIDEAYVGIKFVLPLSNKEASFDDATMNWCLDKTLTYYYDDGTSSTMLDNSKTVVKQVLTGKRHLINSESGNTIPGTGTLSTGIKVKAAPNGTVINPEFYIWMEGNTEDEIKKFEDIPITVSASPKYNISIVADSGVDYLGYFNLESGEYNRNRSDGLERGRLTRYALNFQLYNDSAAKGLKGIEMPKGNVDFDITMDAEIDGVVTDKNNSDEKYQIYLWDYSENNYVSKGHNGRSMTIDNTDSVAYYAPFNRNLNRNETSCYDGGKFNILQDESDSRLYHATISDYQIDYEQMHFPVRYRWSNEGNVTYGANIGCISAGSMMVLSTMEDAVSNTKTLYQDVKISNMHVVSVSGIEGTEATINDNRARRGITLYAEGRLSKYQRYYDMKGNYLSSTYYAGDNISTVGSDIQIESFIHGKAEFEWSDFNLLQKFDDEAIDVDDGSFLCYPSWMVSERGDIHILYAAKPDKTGWSSDTEMGQYEEENLIYFKSIKDLKDAGYTCVAVLYEIRDATTKLVTSDGTYYDLYLKVKVKTDASIIGKVYQTISSLRAWRKDDSTMKFSWTDMPYNADEKSYGAGKADQDYVDGYTKTYTRAISGTSYQKAYYKDGVMYGHNGYYAGNSLLIVGDSAAVNIQNADKTGNQPKQTYDMDAGERIANFTISPSLKIKSENGSVFIADLTDNATVTAILPKNLHYDKSSKDPKSVTENSDGTTTVIWEYPNQSLKEQISPISLSTIIGEEGTANDVVNNETLKIKVSIKSTNDPRATTLVNGNYSETQITIIKLAASAVTKRVMTPLVEIGDDIRYRLRYSNLSDSEALNAKIYDILPYNNDGRSTNFGGMYSLKTVTVDFSHAPKTFDNGKDSVKSYTSIDDSAKDKTNMENTLTTGSNLDKFSDMTGTKTIDSNKKTITWDGISLDNPAAFITYLGYVFGHEYIDIYVTITPRNSDTKQQPQDLYANNFIQYADNQASIVTSNVVKAQVVTRDLSGVAWIDNNGDGIRQDNEQKLSDIIVTLYRDTSSGESKFNNNPQTGLTDPVILGPNGASLTPAHKISGEAITAIKTGADGSYKFDDVEPGTYYIKFTHDEKYRPTAKDSGDSDEVDSDIDVWNANNSYIAMVELPGVANMTNWTYSSPNHDAGFIINTKLSVLKKAADTNKPLAGAELALYKASDIESGKPKDGAVAVETWTSTDQAKMIENKLTAGESYVLIETAAPKGYDISDPITFTAQSDGKTQEIVMTDNINSHEVVIRKVDMDNKLIGGAELKVTGIESATKKQITPIEWTSEAGAEKRLKLRPGSYTLAETKTPAGYTHADNINFTVDDQGITRINGKKYNTLDMLDREIRACKINITKYAADGKRALSGVEFTLTFTKSIHPELASQDGYSRRLKVGESVTLKTDESGKVCFDNLDQGTYTLKESKSLPGYQSLAQTMTIELPMTMTYMEVKQAGNIDTSKADYFDNLYHFYELSYDITNSASFDIPTTGSDGFWMYGMIGALMLTGCTIILIVFKGYNKKKNN